MFWLEKKKKGIINVENFLEEFIYFKWMNFKNKMFYICIYNILLYFVIISGCFKIDF